MSRLLILTLAFAALITVGSLTGGDALSAQRCNDALSWQRLKYLKHVNSHRSGVDIIGNVVLYVPLGMLVALCAGQSPWAWLLFGLGSVMSFSIEVLQRHVGRCSDSIDVVMNSGGYLLGF